ncbi:hypothetical protein D3C77_457930 [compost metagenome]
MPLCGVLSDLPSRAVELCAYSLKRGPHITALAGKNALANELLLGVDFYGAVGVQVMRHELQMKYEWVEVGLLYLRVIVKLHGPLDRSVSFTVAFVTKFLCMDTQIPVVCGAGHHCMAHNLDSALHRGGA